MGFQDFLFQSEQMGRMGKLSAVISCLLLTLEEVTSQTDQTQVSERLLPQWLTGIIAVAGFLFLTFVGFLVKKAWCEESRGRTSVESGRENELVMTNSTIYETTLDMVRSKEDMNAYDNLVIDSTDDKVTPM
ncbi:PDZK1-interacting protein 1 [Toxotes jaculatrix]|uniref:PDZK1-interacting protein 1 n=1 Tax=Toxotes jaculatrix TaxID=941984 RepID=UPI001B3A98A8|nr:PDZK1-interacting protein 1 [Toxotes jaculatrix]